MKVLKPLQFCQDSRIALSTNKRLEMITLNRIVYCEANGNYSVFHLSDGNTYMLANTLKSVSQKLKEHGFFVIDRSYMVNLMYIKSLTIERNTKVLLDGDAELKVARNRKTELLGLLLED